MDSKTILKFQTDLSSFEPIPYLLHSFLNHMKSFYFIILPFVLISFSSCEFWPGHNGTLPDNSEDQPRQVIMADPSDFDWDDQPHDYFTLKHIELENDTLEVEVGYSGCGPREFEMVFWNWFMESEPVQAYAMFSFRPEDCDAWFEDTFRFDLTPLKEEYQKYYSPSGAIDISIVDQDSTHGGVRYEF